MKFRALVYFISKMLGEVIDENTPRADMYLPTKVLSLGIVLIIGSIFAGIIFFIKHSFVCLFLWVIFACIGCAAILSYKNQKIIMINEMLFEYTTFLGNTYTYEFTQITGARQNSDSITVFLGNKKVHIESCAIISERLADAINSKLETLS